MAASFSHSSDFKEVLVEQDQIEFYKEWNLTAEYMTRRGPMS